MYAVFGWIRWILCCCRDESPKAFLNLLFAQPTRLIQALGKDPAQVGRKLLEAIAEDPEGFSERFRLARRDRHFADEIREALDGLPYHHSRNIDRYALDEPPPVVDYLLTIRSQDDLGPIDGMDLMVDLNFSNIRNNTTLQKAYTLLEEFTPKYAAAIEHSSTGLKEVAHQGALRERFQEASAFFNRVLPDLIASAREDVFNEAGGVLTQLHHLLLTTGQEDEWAFHDVPLDYRETLNDQASLLIRLLLTEPSVVLEDPTELKELNEELLEELEEIFSDEIKQMLEEIDDQHSSSIELEALKLELELEPEKVEPFQQATGSLIQILTLR